jgi:hypothetical protein
VKNWEKVLASETLRKAARPKTKPRIFTARQIRNQKTSGSESGSIWPDEKADPDIPER